MAYFIAANTRVFGELVKKWADQLENNPQSLPTDYTDFVTECNNAGTSIQLVGGTNVTKVVFVPPPADDEVRVMLARPGDYDHPPLPNNPETYPLNEYYDSAYVANSRLPIDDMTPVDKNDFRLMRIGEYSSAKCV